MQIITANQAFKAMFFFLDHYYERKYLDFLGGILGELNISADGRTMDPAAGIEWLECLEKVIKEPLTKEKKKTITIDEAFDAMYLILEKFSDQMKQPKDLIILLNDLKEYKEKGVDSEIGKEWLKCIDEAIANDYPLDVSKFRRSS